MKHTPIKALFLVLLATFALSLPGAIPATERAALIALYNGTKGPDWDNKSGWKTPPLAADGFAKPGTEGAWYGVTVTVGHVTRISLANNELSGVIPSTIGDLTGLISLDLSRNWLLKGPIPPEIGKLIALESLDLNSDWLTGAIPTQIGNLANLKKLNLRHNEITVIPAEIGNLTHLEFLDLGSNSLSGAIPPEIDNLIDLIFLDLSENWDLVGSIPPEIGNLTGLETLDLTRDRLTGAIPTQIGNLANLRKLNLHSNQLTGVIPAEIGNLAHLEFLDLGFNRLTGAIPPEIGNLHHLISLNFEYLQLTGPIPSQIGNLTNLESLDFAWNNLSGTIPTEIGNLSKLRILELQINNFTGDIPASIGNLSSLQKLYLYKNQLTGFIPPEIGKLTKLTSLILSKNQLTGSIPTQICVLPNLNTLSLDFNHLTGIIPAAIGNLSRLYSLNLASNQLTGNIPATIGNLTSLSGLDLGQNQLTGNIPASIGNLIHLWYILLGSNQLKGPIPKSMVNLQHLNYSPSPYESGPQSDISYNGLYTTDPELISFLHENIYGWEYTQTIAPRQVRAAAAGDSTVNLTWEAIRYIGDPGGYRIYMGTSSGGPYTFYQQTADKTVTSMPVTGLNSGKRYYFVIRTRTEAHGDQQNIVESGNSAEASAATLPGSITVTSPAAGAPWEKGMTYAITWLKQGTQNANVRIMLYKGTSTLVSTIGAKTANDGTFDWTVPAALAAGSAYFIKVQTSDNLVKATSGKFSIIVPAIRITSPASGMIWANGTTRTIAWTKAGTQDANVKIQLFKDTIKKLDIALSAPNSGSFDWAIPTTLVNGTYAIKVITLDGKVKGTSKSFSIVKSAGLTLTFPNGNEIMKPVETQTIQWTLDPDVLEIKLEFSRDNGSTYATIADHVANTGNYDWIVPVNFTPNARIRVSDASGRPWIHEGILEYSLKFIYNGEGAEPGAALWFGSTDPKAPSYKFAKIDIGRNQVQFAGFAKAIEPLSGGWHELRARFDFRRDTAEIRLDDQVLFENAPLNSTRERYFQPLLVLQAGGEKALDFAMDDLAISVVQLDEEGADMQLFNVLADDFDRYDGRANSAKNCWRWLEPADKQSSVELGPDGRKGNAIRLRTEAGKQMLIFLPFSLPGRVPFDISDQCFNIEN